MRKADYHAHTTFCDGKSSPEEMVLSAIEKGLEEFGLSGHSYTPFDESYCMSREGTEEYKKEVLLLKEKYKDKISLKLGIEQDLFSPEKTDAYDYVIGSVHYFKFGGEYVPVDNNAKTLLEAAEKYCGGDIYALTEKYYEQVALLKDMRPNIIGHFDLIMKFNENGELFDKANERYRKAWQRAANALLELNVPFEINTGAISRGVRTTPYPDDEIYRYLKDRGASFIFSSDSHHKDAVGFGMLDVRCCLD